MKKEDTIFLPVTTPNIVRFWATVCETVRHMLPDGCVSCLSACLSCPACNFGVLRPNCWTDQDETRQVDRPRPRPHCIKWGPSSPPKGHSLQFSAYVRCGQTAGWIKIPLRMEVSLGPGDIVLDGDPIPQKRAQTPIFGPCLVSPNGCMYLDTTWYRGRPQPK